ncbi:endo-1,3(4)-beta-glucanase [Cordyceps javanica]|uniref:Endo-1,3(4)-beta-glucanase n=1 Tax=Cordyceps javanica TaxID=43265 RepID=A0A545UX90_9HYPO|nr:endo-1,3(4)-beta-glucanase [Cordyceps javanica]TQW05961.1 endo-1,3(4)-beta-glucanase [Cordyceps javanica]
MAFRQLAATLLFTPFFFTASTAVDLIEDTSCDCFLSNGTNPDYYAKHAFFDFRQLSQHAGVPDVVEDASKVASAPASSDYFRSDAWTSFWEVESWDNRKAAASKGSENSLSNDATVYMINSASNIYIEKAANSSSSGSDGGYGGKKDAATFLTMRTKRLRDFQTAAEFQTAEAGYQFLSLRMRARTVGAPGAVTAMFTYRGADDPAKVQESDMEVLTRGPPSVVQYTNQPSDLPGRGEIAGATRNATLPGGAAWSDWAVHRLDWTPRRSVWYVDGREAASIAFQVPRDPAAVNLNAWSDGGSWSGNMTVGGEASLQIQWIEMLYNTTRAGKRSLTRQTATGPGGRHRMARRRSRGGCKVVCTIDHAAEVGRVALLANNTASGAAPNTKAADASGFLVFGWAVAVILYTTL